MRRLLVLAAAAVVAAAVPSFAEDVCVGTEEDVLVCVRPGSLPTVDPEGDQIGRCVTVGAPPCHKVTVPVPTVGPGDGGSPVYVDFGGETPISTCAQIDPPVCG